MEQPTRMPARPRPARQAGMPVALMCLTVVVAGCGSAGWPTTSIRAPERLDLPSIQQRAAELSPPPDGGYGFAVFGDQRALANGEWQELMGRLGDIARAQDRLLFMIDTGDMVKDGRHADQFWRLHDVVSSVGPVPYLVGIGNHEVHNNSGDRARANTAEFFGYLDERLAADRLFYVKNVGPVRFLFLDTNDLVYGDNGDGRSFRRAESQMQWLAQELDHQDDAIETTVVIMHHPFVLSGTKHREQAASLWNQSSAAGRLPELLVEGGVDIVLTGHTHTYERFRLRRGTSDPMHVINVSGRPTGFFRRGRRARDIRGQEKEVLADRGWGELDGWTIQQEDAMLADQEANQFALLWVEPDGGVLLDLYFLDPSEANGLRAVPSVRLK